VAAVRAEALARLQVVEEAERPARFGIQVPVAVVAAEVAGAGVQLRREVARVLAVEVVVDRAQDLERALHL